MRRGISAVLALTMLFGLTACGSDDDPAVDNDDAATATTEAAAEPTAIALTYDGKAATATPATAKGGLIAITYTNSSKGASGFLLARLDDGKTVADAKAFDEANKDKENAPPPPFVKIQGGASAEPGKTATYTSSVAKGSYLVFVYPDGDDNQDEGEQYVALDVSDGEATELPETEAVITGTEYSYDIKGLKAGENEVTVKNVGGLPHIYVIFGLKPDGSIDKVIEHEGDGPAPGATGFDTSLSYLDAGKAFTTKVDLPAGKYGMVCFLDNAPGGKSGKPHFLLGMKQEFTVS